MAAAMSFAMIPMHLFPSCASEVRKRIPLPSAVRHAQGAAIRTHDSNPRPPLGIDSLAHELFDDIVDTAGLIAILYLNAIELKRAGELVAAAESYRQALRLAEDMGWVEGRATALAGLGGVLKLMGRFDEARDLLAQALARLESVESLGASLLESTVGAALHAGDGPESMASARRELLAVAETANSVGLQVVRTSVELEFAMLNLAAGDSSAARLRLASVRARCAEAGLIALAQRAAAMEQQAFDQG